MIRAIFGARAQLIVGTGAFYISVGFHILGCFIIPGAFAWPWHWTAPVFIFHASMFALELASWAIVTGALGYRETERVHDVVAETADVEHADTVDVDVNG